jgi:hypothetical protein
MSTMPPLSPDVTPNPKHDGVDHINVYSRGLTQLGQALSNFAHIPFNHPQYGFFASVEAFWYWVGTGMKHDDLRRLYSGTAKSAGIRKNPVKMDEHEFAKIIQDGLRLKIAQNPKLREALKASTLPFRHYFVYGNNPPVVREQSKHMWQMKCLENIRTALKEGRPILLSDGTPAETQTIREIPENPMPREFQLSDD